MIVCDCGLQYLDWGRDEMCPRCKNRVKEIDEYDAITADRDRLQAEADRWETAYDELHKTYLEIIVTSNDNAEALDRMTARCKAAEEERDSYMFLLKGLLECGDCKICEDGRAEIDDLFKAWLTLKNKEVGK